MLKIFCGALITISIFSCKNKNIPDVSSVKIELTTKRFEKDLFALDTTNILPQLDKLIAKYPSFGELYLSRILGLDASLPPDTVAVYLKSFLSYYQSVYDTSQKIFSDFSPYEKKITKSLQYVKYYFPNYKVPAQIITFIGPADGYGDAMDGDGTLLIGLQAHLGKDYALYKTEPVQEKYPAYVSETFTPDYIAINAMRNIVNDLFPEKSEDKPLVEQMVEKGKRLYLLSKFLPETEEYKLIGYTKKQMEDSYAHEAVIWNLFVQNNFLQTTDNNLTKNYVTEGPKTQELGEGAPGNIGSFAGWQIVKKYAQKNPELTPDQIMKADAEKIFSDAKYKP
jgi:hypothetical protein